MLKAILWKVINLHGATAMAEVLDNVKAMGYKYSTIAGMTVSISDMTVPPEKPQLIAEAQATVDRIERNYRRGFATEEERYKEVVETWKETDRILTKKLLDGRRPRLRQADQAAGRHARTDGGYDGPYHRAADHVQFP